MNGRPGTGRRRDALLVLAVAVAAAAYVPLNVPRGTAHQLLGSVEQSLPIVPVLAVPYLVLLPVFWGFVVGGLVRSNAGRRPGESYRALLVAALAAFIASDLVFLTYPTLVPRPAEVHGVLAGLLRLIYDNDNRFNDLPSLHAVMSTLLILHARSVRSRWVRWATILLASTALLATVFLRQHSILGAVAGVGLAACAWWWATRHARRT